MKMPLSDSEIPDPKSSNTSKRKIVWAEGMVYWIRNLPGPLHRLVLGLTPNLGGWGSEERMRVQ